MASDCSSTVRFVQKAALRDVAWRRRPRSINADVRQAILHRCADRGWPSLNAYKVKAHTTREQAEQGLITTQEHRVHNNTVDETAKKAVEGLSATLRSYIGVMAARGKLYIKLLQELSKHCCKDG